MIDDFDFLLNDRITKVRSFFNKYNDSDTLISFSGGKDSTVLHYLVDMALPDNNIPRVFCNTGIEYKLTVDFVKDLSIKDKRFVIIPAKANISSTLNDVGFPFKSKIHSAFVDEYNRQGLTDSVIDYLSGNGRTRFTNYPCPKILRYQFQGCDLKISDRCCEVFKKEPIVNYSKDNGYNIHLLGLRRDEGGRRQSLNCVSTYGGIIKFSPLSVCDDSFIDTFINKFNVRLSPLYYEPFNFKRTGCKGCPFNIDVKDTLLTLKEKLPAEYRQCINIFGSVYSEYKRIGYRGFNNFDLGGGNE